MDSFDYDSLDRYIRKFKRNIINKLESTNLSEKDLKNQSDLLCMVLDYSPKMYDEKKFIKKIEIKPSTLLLEDLNTEKNNIRSLILEKQVSNEENSFDSDKEQTIKLSRLSSKICRSDLHHNNTNGKTPTKENLLLLHIKEILYEIVSKAISIANNNVNLELKISSNYNSSSKSDNESKVNDEKFDNLEDDKVKVDYDVPITSEREKNILSQNIEELQENNNNENYLEVPNEKNNKKSRENEADPPADNTNDNNNDNKFLDDEEEEEFFRQCQSRRQKMEDKRNSEYIKNIHNTISHSKFANKLRGALNVKIYILNNNKPFNFEVSYTDTIKDLKLKIYKQIEKDSRFKLNYKSLDAYELRMVDDDSDDINTKFEMPALADKLNICKTGYDAMAFVEKNLSSIDAESLNMNILGSTTNNTETKVTLKVHFKFEKDGNKYTIIQENGERTLKNVLEKLSTKNKINYRNFDLYYFIEHADSQKEDLDDMDNAIGMETQLKFLNNYELDLYFKKFPDAPESNSLISSYLSQNNVKNYDYSNTYNQRLIKKDNDDQGREFLFNDRTAGAYQEFEVIKINKYKSKQERILGIDMYNLYNDLPKHNAQPNLLKNIFFGGTKKPLRRIRDIVNCGYLSTKMFFIEIKSIEGKNKQIIYEVKQVNIRNEIVAKVKYLIVNYTFFF